MSDSSKQSSKSRSFIGRFWKLAAGLLIVLSVLILLVPTIIAKTFLRDALINTAIANENLAVSTGSASFGYMTPLSIRDFQLRETNGVVNVKINQIETEKSWLILLFSKRDLGTFRFSGPNVEVVTGIAQEATQGGAVSSENAESAEAEPDPAAQADRGLPKLVAEITDAAVRLRNVGSAEPALDLRDIDFTVRIEDGKTGSNIVVDPTTILDNAELTPELCGQGLQLVVPTMSNIVNVTGRISFRLDRCIVPVGQMQESARKEAMQISGAIGFSKVTVGLKSGIMKALLPLLDRLGKSNIPSVMTISETSSVEFRVVDGRIEHKGLVMQMPMAGSALEIESSGSVGVDESIDVQLAISIPNGLLGDSALAKFFQVESVQIQVSGTLDDPQIKLDSTGGWADRLQTLLEPRGPDPAETAADETGAAQDNPEDAANQMNKAENIADSILGIVDGLLEKSPGEEQQNLPSLRDRIRSQREESQGRRRLFPRANRRNSDEPSSPIAPSKEPTEI